MSTMIDIFPFNVQTVNPESKTKGMHVKVQPSLPQNLNNIQETTHNPKMADPSRGRLRQFS